MSDDDNIKSVESTEEPIIHLTENGVEGFESLCRLCATLADHLVPIYNGEGLSNDLANKMNLYLPVKVCQTDLLPLQCCFPCANTVLSWHELVVASVEADHRLRNIQTEVEKQLAQQQEELALSQQTVSDDMQMKEEEAIKFEENEQGDNVRSASLNQVRLEQGQTRKNSKKEQSPSTPKKRGRPKIKKETVKEEVKVENELNANAGGEWIKTELILESDDIDPFIADCAQAESELLKMSPGSGINNSDLDDNDDSDPEYDPLQKASKTYTCPACDRTFSKIKVMRKHLKVCSVDIKDKLLNINAVLDESSELFDDKKILKDLRCGCCPLLAFSKEDLKNHIQTEHPDKFSILNEKRQRRTQVDQEAIDRAKIVVNSRTYYHCNECGKNLHSPYTFIWHKRIHTGERPFVCDLCGKQFRVSQGLVRHLRETHAGIKNFPCDLCGRMFATRRNVEEHRRIHTNERPYVCDLCGKSFKQKASLFVHNRLHTDSFPFKCSYCNQAFRTRPPLLVHVTRHTGEKPYACDVCGRCFRIKYELKRHRLIHSDDKPFSCTDCGLSFRQKRYLRNHNKVNHNRPTP